MRELLLPPRAARTAVLCLALLVEQAGTAAAGSDTDEVRTFRDAFNSFQVHLGIESAGPVLFQDTPDGRVEEASVFEYGARLGFLFGEELLDLHRLGASVRWDSIATSEAHDLRFITPQVLYEIGHPLILQAGVGYSFASGTDGYAEKYKGWATSAAVRWSFRRRSNASPLSTSLGLVGQFVAASTFEKSSAFVGLQLEVIFHRAEKGAL